MTNGLSRAQKRQLQQMRNDATAVLKHPPSMRFLCRMLAELRYYDDPFAGNSNTTFKNIGEQEAGRKIVRALETADDDALLILLETAKKTRVREGRENEGTGDED